MRLRDHGRLTLMGGVFGEAMRLWSRDVSVEAGMTEMLDRMQSGRFKVLRHLNDGWEEFRLFHRKAGRW